MTKSELRHIENDVITLINEVLDLVKDKKFSDYVLLLARASYQVELEHTGVSPYVLSSQLEIHQDITRERFLVEYLNSYVSLLDEDVIMADDVKEFNLNIQMMIYSMIWESHILLKYLLRIGGILSGEPYLWKIDFESVNRKGRIVPCSKCKIIEDQILKSLKSSCPDLETFIRENYDHQLRNNFAHALYDIRIDYNAIVFWESDRFMEKKRIGINDWERIFLNSVFLSYHLPRLIKGRSNSFMIDYPDINEVVIDWPLHYNPGKILPIAIYPQKVQNEVEFSFHAPVAK